VSASHCAFTGWEYGIAVYADGGTISSASFTDNYFSNTYNAWDNTAGHTYIANCWSDLADNAGFAAGEYQIDGATPVNIDHYPNVNCETAPSIGYTELLLSGPPDWAYRLHWVSGAVSKVVFTNFCSGTTGHVSGAASTNWTMLAGGDGNDGDSIIFVASVPLTSGTAETFWLSHPSCSDIVQWCAGDSCGHVDGPLPVELTSFDAVPGDNSVTLKWATASETGTDFFEISRDGHLATRVNAQGTNAGGSRYAWTDDAVLNGTTYVYTLTSIDNNGDRHILRTINATPVSAGLVITDYALRQNYPNPFNPTTEISYDMKEAGAMTLKVYNLMGQTIATLVNGNVAQGRHVVTFDAANLPSGVYIYRMETTGFSAQARMLLIR
jgi:hypothetical protein